MDTMLNAKLASMPLFVHLEVAAFRMYVPSRAPSLQGFFGLIQWATMKMIYRTLLRSGLKSLCQMY